MSKNFLIPHRQTWAAALLCAGLALGSSATLAADAALENLNTLQGRLNTLGNSGVAQDSYNYAKAQCWIDTAKTQYLENDRSGYVQEAATQAGRIISALEADKNAAPMGETPLIAGSDKVRTDLWSQLQGLRTGENAKCAAKAVACAEVRLVMAGHANQQTGWKQANPHVCLVEGAVERAKKAVADCAPPPPPPAPPAPPPVAEPERYRLPGDALFAFDRSDWNSVLPAGQAQLAELVTKLKAYKTIESLSIVGHTDRLGSNTYNQALSEARALTIKQYLLSQGINAGEINATGAGEDQPVTTAGQCPDKMGRKALIQCLQPDRRIELVVKGVK